MVFRDEQGLVAKSWPLGSLFNGGKQRPKSKMRESSALWIRDDDEDEWENGHAYDLADCMEKGIARELAADFICPLRRSTRLWQFHVVRSESKLEYRLFSADGDFLMFARVALEAREVLFFLYNPTATGGNECPLYDPKRPAFSMAFNERRTEWRLVQNRCEVCQFLPRHRCCDSFGKQQVGFIQHTRDAVGNGICNRMHINIPGLYSDGSRVVWCPCLGRGDLANPEGNGRSALEVQHLITRSPDWNEDCQSLVLDFRGRCIQSSPKNFQLALRQKPDHVVCQYGKIGPSTFGLDFKYPLSVVQAFSASMTTLFWI